ncbi:glyoxalase [Spartobacteria bacterium LR76]|nr:glyoxalase [Spartobacteria bacterium LR76]
MHFAYTILYVSDVTASLAHYEAAYGFATRFLHESGTYGELDTGATTLGFAALELGEMNLPGGVESPNRERRPFPSEIAFATPDVDSAYQRAVSAGAIGVSTPTQKPWGQTVAYLRDLDGHLVELCTPIG